MSNPPVNRRHARKFSRSKPTQPRQVPGMPILVSSERSRARVLAMISCGVAALGVILGAFGAHGLEEHLLAVDRLDTWETAAHYHLLHALAALLAATLGQRLACQLFLGGILVFSGSLYLLCLLPAHTWLGMITPLGGLLFLAGWGWLGWQMRRA